MEEKVKELYSKFKEIKKKGWIESMRGGTTGIGYTFESLIGKKEENFPLPDYNGIEIKTMNQFGKGKLHLFNATPDGDYLFPIKRILDELGYPDKSNPEYKVFNISCNTREYTKIGYHKKVILYVNRLNKKVEFIAFKNGKNIDISTSWSFDLLREHLYNKLKYLCIVEAESKIKSGINYYKYKYIHFFMLKDFDTFINLIESGKIIITFKIGVFKSGARIGQIHDHGTDFSISIDNISALYKKI